MTKVDTSGLERQKEALIAKMKEVLGRPEVMADVANELIDDIRYQSRRGISIVTEEKFPELSDNWIDQRSRVTDAKHQAFSRRRSNITVTGQLLDALRHSLIGFGKIKLYFEGQHNPYTIKGKRGKDYQTGSISNADLAEALQDQGREFLGVRESIIPRIKKILAAAIRRSAKDFKN